MTYDELVEKVAIAMYGGNRDAFENIHPFGKKGALEKAKAAIAAIREVLNIDTEEMINAAEMYSYQGYPKGYGGLWRAMLAASPLGESTDG